MEGISETLEHMVLDLLVFVLKRPQETIVIICVAVIAIIAVLVALGWFEE